MALSMGFLLLAGVFVWLVSAILDIFFLKWSYNRVNRGGNFKDALKQWVFLLLFNLIVLIPLIFLSMFTLFIGYVVSIVVSILLMKLSADIAYGSKHTWTEGFRQWAWLLLYRIVTYLILGLIFSFIIIGILV